MKITAIKQQAQPHARYSIYVDGAYAFSLSEGALIESRLVNGQELDATELAALKRSAGVDKAYGMALRYIAIRPRSEWELTDYLRRKGVGDEHIRTLSERLAALDLLNDLRFARSWIASRRILKTSSRRRLALELQQKRVANDTIRAALAEDDNDDRSQLRELVTKKSARYPDRRKLMQYLARQGFAYDDIKAVLEEAPDDF